MVEDYPQWTKNVLELAAGEKGTMLYHCTTGKDRTGILTALLLSIAGVGREDIIADYCVSEVYMRPVYLELMGLMPPYIDENGNELNPTIDSPFFKTAPDNMRELLDHFDSNYGGAVGFALHCGADMETIDAIRHKLTDQGG
jgi:protein-tyrosine phosphatase